MNTKFVAMETTYENAKKMSANIVRERSGYRKVQTIIENYRHRVKGKCRLKMTTLVCLTTRSPMTGQVHFYCHGTKVNELQLE